MPLLLFSIPPEDITPDVRARIHTLAPELEIMVSQERAEIAPLLDQIEIAVGDPPLDLIVQAQALRWYQLWSAGSDWLLRYPQAAERPFVVTTASGVHAIPISEHIIGTLLMFARGLHHAVRAQQRNEWWRPEANGVFELAGKTMLLLGVGAIGGRTAMLARSLGMRVEGIRRDVSKPVDGVDAMYSMDQLRERLPHADVVVLTIPLSRDTRGLIGANELRAMKQGSYLINIGRGGTIDEPALVEALAGGYLAGAALDVFMEEPLPASSPLWQMEHVIITGHYAGMNRHYGERAMAIFLDNLERYKAGTPLRNQVDKQVGY